MASTTRGPATPSRSPTASRMRRVGWGETKRSTSEGGAAGRPGAAAPLAARLEDAAVGLVEDEEVALVERRPGARAGLARHRRQALDRDQEGLVALHPDDAVEDDQLRVLARAAQHD